MDTCMLPHLHEGDEWRSCTLCRSTVQSRSVLNRARERQVDWSRPKELSACKNSLQDPVVYTNIDDAFSSVLQYMNTTSKLCKRYYKSCGAKSSGANDSHHCSRFHTPNYTKAHRKNPLQTSEDVHLHVNPGTYAVTAGEWGTNQQQTHVVRVNDGQTVSLDFVM